MDWSTPGQGGSGGRWGGIGRGGSSDIIDWLRTLSARFFARWHVGPRVLRVRAWAWLAAQTDDLREKIRCLEAILELDPDLAWAQMALEGMRYRLVREN